MSKKIKTMEDIEEENPDPLKSTLGLLPGIATGLMKKMRNIQMPTPRKIIQIEEISNGYTLFYQGITRFYSDLNDLIKDIVKILKGS